MNSLNKLDNVLDNTHLQHNSEIEPTSDREHALQTACDILLDYALAVKRATELTVESEQDATTSNESNSQSQIEALHETLAPLQIPNLDRAGQPADAETDVGGVPDELYDSQQSLHSADVADPTVEGSCSPTTAASSFVVDDVVNDTECLTGRPIKLKYHNDATDIRFDGRHLFRSHALLERPPRSRRVLLGGLPANVKLPELMLGLREVKGILSVVLVPPSLAHPISWNGALVEFDCCESANAFLQIASRCPPRYTDSRGNVVSVDTRLINSHSYHATDWRMVSATVSRTRTICVPAAVTMAWDICKALQHRRQIVAIEYVESPPCLYVQFSSVFTATAAWEACNRGRLQTDELWKVKVPCHFALDSIFRKEPDAACIQPVEVDLETLLWDHSTRTQPKFPVESPPMQLTLSELSEEKHKSDSDRYQLLEIQPALRPQRDPERTKKTMEQLAEERKKMLQQSKWDAYGRLSRHRRELARNTGIKFHADIVHCDGTCQFKCRPLQSSPPADVIKDYLSTHQPSYADTGIEGY